MNSFYFISKYGMFVIANNLHIISSQWSRHSWFMITFLYKTIKCNNISSTRFTFPNIYMISEDDKFEWLIEKERNISWSSLSRKLWNGKSMESYWTHNPDQPKQQSLYFISVECNKHQTLSFFTFTF